MAQGRAAPICVTGMHRSGTSLVARLLDLLGADLGSPAQMVLPDPGNPTGFWEHAGFVLINNEILRRFGGSWDEPPRWETGWETSPILDDLLEQGRHMIAHDFAGRARWAWKDPRASLTLPFWQRLLPEQDYVVCFRSPLEVARSLRQRDGLPLEAGFRLWTTYTRGALASTAGHTRVLVAYEDLLRDWPGELDRVARAVGLAGPSEVPGARPAIEAFLDEGLRHHRATAEETAGDERIPRPVRASYQALRRQVQAGRQPVDRDRQDEFDDAMATAPRESRRRRLRGDIGFALAGVVALRGHPGRCWTLWAVHRSGLFDAAYYLRNNPDVAAARVDPYVHFVVAGAAEMRNPHPLFDSAFYATGNPPAGRRHNPLVHFAAARPAPERDPHPLFSSDYYRARSAVPRGGNVLWHYLTVGRRQGLSPHPLFDPAFYLGRYRDVADAGVDPLSHFIEFGGAEGRWPHPLFDTAFYLAHNPDVAASGENPLVHYVCHGAREGRRPHPALAASTTLARALPHGG
jgi:hypothetical protein